MAVMYKVESKANWNYAIWADTKRTSTKIIYVGCPRRREVREQTSFSHQPEGWPHLCEPVSSCYPTGRCYDQGMQFCHWARQGCKKSAGNNTVGWQCIWGQDPVSQSNKLNHQCYYTTKKSQNSKMDRWHCGCCQHRHLERLVVKPSTQPTSRALWLSSLQFSSQKDPDYCSRICFHLKMTHQSTPLPLGGGMSTATSMFGSLKSTLRKVKNKHLSNSNRFLLLNFPSLIMVITSLWPYSHFGVNFTCP